MMNAIDAINAARTVLPGSPEHAIACDLCWLRGLHPNDPAHFGQVTHWQWVIAEKILEEHLRHMLGRGAKAQTLMAN